jgi:hypothetical protein
MYTREKDNVIYVYRNQELFLRSLSGRFPHGIQMMYSADYAIELVRNSDGSTVCGCRVLKDRSGVLSRDNPQKIEKMFKIIEILLEDSEILYK